jgi:predicted nucleic acid-binding protein
VIVISDAGPIIHLSLIGRLDLLPSLYGRVLIPGLVYREVVETGEDLPGSSELRDAAWAEQVEHDPEAVLFKLLRSELDPGEAAAICLAVEKEAALVLSDDRQARLLAQSLGFQVVGTLGILVEGKRRALVSELAPLLLDLKAKGVWLSTSLIQEVLSAVGESLS